MIQDISPHHLDNVFHPGTSPGPDSILFIVSGSDVLACRSEDGISFPRHREVSAAAPSEASPDTGSGAGFTYLFRLDQTDCFWLNAEISCPEKYHFYSLRELRKSGCGPKYLFFAAYTALQLINWYRDNAYCGRCASPTGHSLNERALICPRCLKTVYPRINPAVIVGVTDGDKIVLTKYAGRDVPYYALIAGFTEIGETLEETVAREVMEEVGLRVKNIRYYKSQPWAMADDILMGFYCDVDGDTTIRLDRNELKEGGWYRREEVILQPDDYSLTNEMMKLFQEGKDRQ